MSFIKDDKLLFYNCDENWNLELWGTSRIRLQYTYTNRLDEHRGIQLFYEIESRVGQSILDLAAQIVKK